MGYKEEGRPLRAEDPCGPEEVGLLSASESITPGSSNPVHYQLSSFMLLLSTVPAWG